MNTGDKRLIFPQLRMLPGEPTKVSTSLKPLSPSGTWPSLKMKTCQKRCEWTGRKGVIENGNTEVQVDELY